MLPTHQVLGMDEFLHATATPVCEIEEASGAKIKDRLLSVPCEDVEMGAHRTLCLEFAHRSCAGPPGH